ncbi:hybrid sensor histidine kinase/response regulator [Paraburkholderia sabiae]|jgi:signal transduction histidine kinase/ActR/RegA family two-component response regulator|uniref:histidine kinase n=1 Tax=Paraburkholderia sabiae TaxID=273251 RepID=A0ABU9QM82_9BURK|nr:ATP-binding protein [Paraburkholderia sabiae]WJZ75721.1 ATP-binding protein [Paraburkholderia sabiae]CAD6560489.1 Sensor histidine kinase RcsC [Paraburkholderia sabiae]CAG9214793.1 Histidine kinase [Paraburkholderia sabiae]
MADQGSHRQIGRRPLRRVVLVVIWIAALAAPITAISYLLYSTLLNPRATQQVTGTYDGFYWDAAQLQIAYARLESQLLLYQTGVDSDYPRLTLHFQVLQSKLRVMAGSTQRLAAQAESVQRQQEELAGLSAMLVALQPSLDALPTTPALASQMVEELRKHWKEVNDLAQSRRNVDLQDREAMNTDFIAKRRMLFAGGLVLLLLSAAATALLVMNGRRRTKLILQQHAALDAEHQASRAAREASLAKDAFLGMISHELRTPLHAIVSSIELLGFNFHSDADRKVIQRLETAARHLEAQMKDLTDYARLGAGKLELRNEHFDPRELLVSIVDENEPAARAKGLAFEGSASGRIGLVDSDPHRVRQIVNNLVTNGIRYTERGRVTLHFEQRDDALTVVVTDTGAGVPNKQIPLIFKEFTQLDSSRSRRFEGAGMGLAIVQGLVDLFGGTIDVDSEVGKGTRFAVTIPVTSVAAPAGAAAAPQATRGEGRPQVLIVDDNQLIRESLCEMLAHMGCDAAAVAKADDAHAWLAARRCDLVLLDLHMPDKDGYAFMAEYNEKTEGQPADTRTPVIAVSAYAPDGTQRAEADLFFDSLTKPVHYEVLRVAVQRALAARHGASVAG